MWSQIVAVFFFLVGTISCSPQGRVVNGANSKISKYPFMVSLREPLGSHSCGGTIIAPNWVLTAAHCVNMGYAYQQTIQYGLTDISINGPNVVSIRRIIMHPEYEPENFFKNDIALIELAGTIVFNYKTVAPVQLPEYGFEIPQLAEGESGVLAGWGLNATFGERQKTLQEVDLKIYSDKKCQEIHKNRTDKDQICAGFDMGGKGACRSDSGGPLIYHDSIQLGVVSWGAIECATMPDVYVKVSHYIDWINKYIR